MVRKTAAITAASIAGVILAGGAAVGANIGILNAADESNLGNLSADAAVVSPVSTTEAPLDVPTVESQTPTENNQSFIVDVAGEIEVDISDSGLHISGVRTNQGWTWQEQTAPEGTVAVSFTSGGDELVFTATSNDDGTISASVDRPAPEVTASQTSAPTASGSHGSTYDHDEYEDDDHDEYEDDDHDEYEDDDHDEYEGRDEDD